MALGKEIHHIKDWLLLDPTATMISADALAAVERACQIDHDGQGHIIVTYFGRFGGCSYINHQREEACCTIICFRGREGKRKVETILNKLSPNIRNEYTSANTYHDGKRLAIAVDSDEAKADIKRRLTLKRKPKRTEQKSISEMESNEGT